MLILEFWKVKRGSRKKVFLFRTLCIFIRIWNFGSFSANSELNLNCMKTKGDIYWQYHYYCDMLLRIPVPLYIIHGLALLFYSIQTLLILGGRWVSFQFVDGFVTSFSSKASGVDFVHECVLRLSSGVLVILTGPGMMFWPYGPGMMFKVQKMVDSMEPRFHSLLIHLELIGDCLDTISILY